MINENYTYKAGGIIISGRRLLVERSKGKDFFVAPGGSVEADESPKQALIRELKEEFQIETNERDLKFFGTFEAPAADQELEESQNGHILLSKSESAGLQPIMRLKRSNGFRPIRTA